MRHRPSGPSRPLRHHGRLRRWPPHLLRAARATLPALLLALAACHAAGGQAGEQGGGTTPPPNQPVRTIDVLAQGPSPAGAAVVGGRIVWSESGAAVVRAVAVAGGEPATLASRFRGAGLGVAGASLYRAQARFDGLGAATGTVIVRSGLDGSAPEQIAVASTGAQETLAILRAGQVVAARCDQSPSRCTLRLVPLDGRPPTDLVTVEGSIAALDADATHAYWIRSELSSELSAPLQRIPLSGGPTELVAAPAAQALLGAFALDGQGVVLSEVDTRAIVPITQGTLRRLVRVPAGGGARLLLGERSGSGGVLQVALVGQEVVWRDDTGVYSTPLVGGATTALAAAPLPADYAYGSILAAGDALYCSAMGPGPLHRGFVAPLAGGVGWGDLSAPSLFAADDAFLYWNGSSAQVSRAPRAGGPGEAVAGGFGGPPMVASGGGRLYGAEGSVVKEVDLAGGVPRVRLLADDTIYQLAADEEAAYARTAAGSLWRVPAAGGPAQRVSGGFYGITTRLRASGGVVYWNETLPPSSSPYAEAIYRMTGTGGDRVLVAEVAGGVEDLVVAGAFVYFKATGGGVGRVPATGGAVQALTGPMDGPLALAADETHLYAAGGIDVVKVPLAGGDVVTLHHGDFVGPNALAVDGTAVYWTDAYYEAVLRLSPK